MRLETAVQSPLQKTEGTGLKGHIPQVCLDGLLDKIMRMPFLAVPCQKNLGSTTMYSLGSREYIVSFKEFFQPFLDHCFGFVVYINQLWLIDIHQVDRDLNVVPYLINPLLRNCLPTCWP